MLDWLKRHPVTRRRHAAQLRIPSLEFRVLLSIAKVRDARFLNIVIRGDDASFAHAAAHFGNLQ
jgi:hypothetical protein